jgi:hypothetical protein
MSKYRFKTEREFIEDNLWSFAGTPLHWASSKAMNEYLGEDVPDGFIDQIENDESFHIKSWTFRANNCILKTPVTKFIKGDTVRVISTTASDEAWAKIGRIDVDFKIGDIITVIDITNYSLKLKNYAGCYPLSMFEKYDKPIKEYTVKDFVEGQSVKVIAITASATHWEPLGKISVKYNIGDILIVSEVRKGLKFTCSQGYSYPACMFEPLPIKNPVIKDAFFDDVVSAPESLVSQYFKIVKSTGRKELPIGFVGKISKEETNYIYAEGLKTCISKDRIKQGELIISAYIFPSISSNSNSIDTSTFIDHSGTMHNPCCEVEMPITESLDSLKKKLPNSREIVLIKTPSIKKRLKF